VDWTVQVVPFQFSARVKVAFVLVTYHPTAVQADAEVHETPDSALDVAPLGVGVDWRVHAVPFQRSASVDEIGPALRFATATVTQAPRARIDDAEDASA